MQCERQYVMRLFRQETQANAPRCEHERRRTHSPMALRFIQTHLRFFRTHLRFFRSLFITDAGSNEPSFFSNVPDLQQEQITLAEQEVGPNRANNFNSRIDHCDIDEQEKSCKQSTVMLETPGRIGGRSDAETNKLITKMSRQNVTRTSQFLRFFRFCGPAGPAN